MSTTLRVDKSDAAGALLRELRIDRPGEWVTTGVRTIDDSWRGTDSHGHEHAGGNLYATCTELREDCYCSLVNEPHDVHAGWQCKVCGDDVTPGTLPPGHQFYVPGPVSAEAVVIDRSGRESTWSIGSEETFTTLCAWVDAPAADPETFDILATLEASQAAHVVAVTFRG